MYGCHIYEGAFMKSKRVGMVIGGILILAMGFPFLVPNGGNVFPGLILNQRVIDGYTREQVQQLLRIEADALQNKILLIGHETYKYELPLREIDVQIDLSKTEERIFAYGRTGSLAVQWWERMKGYFIKQGIEYEIYLNEIRLDEFLKRLSQDLQGEKRDAFLQLLPDGSYQIVKEKPQIVFDIGQIKNEIRNHIFQQNFSMVELRPTSLEKPSVTKEMLHGMDSMLGEYTTYFSNDYNRSSNIKLATEVVNGTILQPGEVFSYNERTGERTAAAGYLDAPVFVDGKLEPGIGGGICQVSSTLFNVALLSGLEVLERSAHFAPVGYLEIGRDATVSYGSLDFVFKNSLPRPIYIMSEYFPGGITIRILGAYQDVPEKAKILQGNVNVISFSTQERIDEKQLESKKVETGHNGYETTIYREVEWSDGRKIQDSFYSYYDPVDTVITFSSEGKRLGLKSEVGSSLMKAANYDLNCSNDDCMKRKEIGVARDAD